MIVRRFAEITGPRSIVSPLVSRVSLSGPQVEQGDVPVAVADAGPDDDLVVQRRGRGQRRERVRRGSRASGWRTGPGSGSPPTGTPVPTTGEDGGAEVTGGLATVDRSRSAMTTPAPTPSSTAASTTARTRTRPDRRGSSPAASAVARPPAAAPGGAAAPPVGGGGGRRRRPARPGPGRSRSPAAARWAPPPGPEPQWRSGPPWVPAPQRRWEARSARGRAAVRRLRPVGAAVPPGRAPSVRASVSSCPTRTDPSATSCLGWVSRAVGTENSRCSISLTSGMRELPPTSRMLRSWVGSSWAERRARVHGGDGLGQGGADHQSRTRRG